jgi:hypothetical protein
MDGADENSSRMVLDGDDGSNQPTTAYSQSWQQLFNWHIHCH